MPNITKPDNMSAIWAATGTKTAPTTAKISQGHVVELPPYQTANFIENKQDQFNAHVNMHGIAVWDNATEYQGGLSYTKGSDGRVYKCLQTHTNLDPSNPLNALYWTEAFEQYGSVAAVQAQLDALSTNYNTLAGIGNLVAARNNLSVFSKVETQTLFAALNGSASQVFSVAPATLPSHAVRLDQISGLVSQATEVSLGVAKIATSADMATGTNDTNIVTPLKGANTYLRRSLNLADLTNAATARANLGLGSIATETAGSFLRASNNLLDVSNTATARLNLGLGTAATRADSYFLRSANNLSDLTSAASARSNLGLGDSAIRNIGTTVNTVAAGDDSRIVNAVPNSRTVTAGNGMTGGGALTGNITLNLGTPSTVSASTGNSITATSHTHAVDINSWFGNRSLGPTGFYEIPGGFKFMWGTASVSGGSNQTTDVSFPVAFAGTPFGVQCTYRQNTDNDGDSHWVTNVSNTGFTIGNDGAANAVFWFAYGV